MSELTINQLIKIIIGILVVVAVVAGIYLIFKNTFIEFIKGLPSGNSTIKSFMVLIR